MTENLESVSLIWLDNSINISEENLQTQNELRSVINHLILFENYYECLEYIQSRSKNDQIILIVNGQLGRLIVPQISDLQQIISISIYCMDKRSNLLWSKQYNKVIVDVYHSIDRILF